jgi:NAD(P)-dependent dehydrogenase (short-subunit alcohol dehydrogenase family)
MVCSASMEQCSVDKLASEKVIHMPGRLDGKVALVTGGSQGIGQTTALAFATEGARVVIANRGIAGGQETVRMIIAGGGEALFVQTDVTQERDVEALLAKTVHTFGRLDCAFNNAGTVNPTSIPITDCSEEEWERIIGVNLKGVWLCMKYEIAQCLKNGGGSIVNMASIVGIAGSATQPVYTASKHGVVGLTKATALAYAKAGVRINAVCPSYLRTPLLDAVLAENPAREAAMTSSLPINRLGTPDEVAAAVVWLCSDAASFVTGHIMSVDGGWAAQ